MKNKQTKATKAKLSIVPDYVIQYGQGAMMQVSKSEALTMIKSKGLPDSLERVVIQPLVKVS
jgi:hypothetical protein